MNTTAIFIELLIAGVQASLWVMVLLVAFGGDAWFAALMPVLQQWATLVTFMVFTIWYTLGIIVDRFASLLYVGLHKLAAKIVLGELRTNLKRLLDGDPDNCIDEGNRLNILSSEKSVSANLEFTRSRLRIMRETTLNVLRVQL